MATHELMTAAIAKLGPRVEKAVAEALAERDAKIAELQKRLAELEAEPDPGQAPFRGTSVVRAMTPDAERPSAFRGPAGAERERV